MTRVPHVEGDWDFWALYDAGEWEPETRAVLERFLTPGSTFLDIGAWIGPVSMWAEELGAEVVAVEPDPVAYPQLIENVSGRCLNAAVAPTSGTAFLESPRGDDGGLGDSWSRLAPEGVPVATISPADLRAQIPTPALVKVDVEGYETEILPDLVTWGCPLLVAWHEPWWPRRVDVRGWFDGFDCEGEFGGFGSLLAVPR